jgi:hypothetical protein
VGQHQQMIGTSLLVADPASAAAKYAGPAGVTPGGIGHPATGRVFAATGTILGARPGAEAALQAPAAAATAVPVASTSRKIVFKAVAGDIETLRA